ncbi:ECM14-like protein [Fusarium heterosporum]|uniref:ECM14-like protein n=1 Tax=Fusarium heterosporum TaxID=42747 RepID=A0A8H5SSY2_FUSHE|nr:ECM14-like protein [Fusarium heterosporum]
MRYSIASVVTLALGALAVPKTEIKSYSGYKVFRVNTHGNSDVTEKLSPVTFDEWEHGYQHVDIVVAPNDVDAFESLELDYTTLHEDLGTSITGESVSRKKWKRQADDDSWFDEFHNYEDHIDYFRDLQSQFPNNSKIVSSGKSYQKRNIYGLHLYGDDGPGKPAVLYHGSVHAREWIAGPTLEYITLQLVKGFKGGDKDVKSYLNKYDFYIFPFVNPDGFVYSQTADRLWRKNRQPPPASAPNQSCIGRDINRNWEFGWDSNKRGASTDPCSQTYRGEKPTDSPENQGLDTLVRKLRDTVGIALYIDFHSYGQYILSPFGYKEDLYAPELGKWTKAAALVSEAIREASTDQTTYTFGPSGAVLYVTTGAAPDHVYSIGGAKFSYTIELRDTGENGFVLPPEQIRPNVEEQWAGQKVLLSLLDETFFDGKGPALYQGQT